MGSLVEFVLGRDACGEERERIEQQRWSSGTDWEEREADCRSPSAQLWEELEERAFSPRFAGKTLGT